MYKFTWFIGLVLLVIAASTRANTQPEACAERRVSQAYFSMLNGDHQTALLQLDQATMSDNPYPLTDFFISLAYWVDAYLNNNQSGRQRGLARLRDSVALLGNRDVDKQPDDLLNYTIARGHLSRVLFAEDKPLSAIRLARKVQRQASELLVEYPNHPDLLLLLGLLEYHSANIPKEYKWIGRLFNLQGDARLGLIWINKAIASESVFAAEAARALLHETNWRPPLCGQALLAQQLSDFAPRSVQLALLTQGLYLFCGHPQKARIAQQTFPELNHAISVEEKNALLDLQLHVHTQLENVSVLSTLQTQTESEEDKKQFALAQALDVRNLKADRANALGIYNDIANTKVIDPMLKSLASTRLKWPAQKRRRFPLSNGDVNLTYAQCE